MKPVDVYENVGDRKFYRDYAVDGVMRAVPICEDCWQEIPRYIDFPRGLVSPESDGDAGGNFIKSRVTSIGKDKDDGSPQMGVEQLQKVVCLPCYRLAFQRVYPGQPLPTLRGNYTQQIPEVFTEPETIIVGTP